MNFDIDNILEQLTIKKTPRPVIFINYARKDERAVIEIYERLMKAGYRPWMDTMDILPGRIWKIDIKNAIRSADFILVILTENSVDRRGTLQEEIKEALDIWREKLRTDIYIIPLRLDDCEIPESLSGFHCLVYKSPKDFDLLQAAIKKGMEEQGKNKDTTSEEGGEKQSVIEQPNIHIKEMYIKRGSEWIPKEIQQRIEYISAGVIKSVWDNENKISEVVELFREWMIGHTIVRVLGVGRARLAASLPANRLAHGGARIYIQEDLVPMPHSLNCGGIIAVSASGTTESLLKNLKDVSEKGRNIKIVGIANKDADEFRKYCGLFVGISQNKDYPCPLQALGDIDEYIISELMDAMVVAAGKLAGFDDAAWRLGHEDIGRFGPWTR